MTQRKSPNSCLIILICAIVFPLLSLLISWGMTALSARPPQRLPAPPAGGEVILEIDTPSFFETVPIIRTVEGGIYQYDYGITSSEKSWIAVSQPQEIRCEECEKTDFQRFNEIGAEVIACKKIQALGEWCPGQIAHYALDADGNVWLSIKENMYPLTTIILFIVFGIIGAVLGGIISLIRALLRKNRKSENRFLYH